MGSHSVMHHGACRTTFLPNLSSILPTKKSFHKSYHVGKLRNAQFERLQPFGVQVVVHFNVLQV